MKSYWPLPIAASAALMLCIQPAKAEAPKTSNNPLERKVVRVAADLTSMPWMGFEPKTGQHTGFEYDYLKEIFAAIDPSIKVEIIPTLWERVGDAIAQNKADLAFNGFFLPPENSSERQKFEWSNCYFTTSLATIYLKKKGAPQSIADFKKRRVTIFTDDAAITAMKNAGITKYTKSTFDYKFAEFVATGKTDLAVIDKVGAQYMSRKYGDKVSVETTLLKKYSQGCYAAFAKKENKLLIDEINLKGIPSIGKHANEILLKYGITE